MRGSWVIVWAWRPSEKATLRLVPILLAIMLAVLLAAKDDSKNHRWEKIETDPTVLRPSTFFFGGDLLQMPPLAEPLVTEWFGGRGPGSDKLELSGHN